MVYRTARKLVHGALAPPFRLFGKWGRRRIIVYYAFPDFGRKAEAIADLLKREGLPAELRTGVSILRRAQVKSSSDLWLGFWNDFPMEYLPRHYIFINAEPLCVPLWGEDRVWMTAMRNAIEVWEYNRYNDAYLAPLGVRVRHVPFGYAPHYESSFRKHTQGKSLAQDIDVLFVGGVSGRRAPALERLRSLGIKLHTVTRDNSAWGAKLDELLARSKIVLGIHGHSDPNAQIADLARLDLPLSNGLFVLHERPSSERADPDFEKHVPTCSYDDIPKACSDFLGRPEERARLAAVAHNWFKSEYSLDKFLPHRELQECLERLTRGARGLEG